MAILTGDVKLVASQVLADTEEGGGAPTSTVIVDGTSNSLFNDISELDRAGGRVNLRKVFASIQTDTTDTYLGGNVVVADPPDDPRVAVTIFSTDSVFDRRTNARDRIEAYLNKSSLWEGYLLENHITGQRAIQIFMRPGGVLPTIGKTLYLVANEGLGNEFSQYIRITRVASVTRTFTYVQNTTYTDYQAVVVTCDLSDALRYDFPGSPPNRMFAMETGKTKLRDTLVADAAKYCGVVKTTSGIAIGDIAANVDSVFTQLVPSAQTETPLIDATAGGTIEAVLKSSNAGVSFSTASSFAASTIVYCGNSIVPGSLSITAGATTLTDVGGQLYSGATVVGTVDYARGEVAFAASAPTYGGTKVVSFIPTAAPVQVVDTESIPVTIESRSYNYVLTFPKAPAPGSLTVSYLVQGNWYDLRDNGAGVLKGTQPEYGVGTINYITGTMSVTLGALPDVGSEVVMFWGGPALYRDRTDLTVVPPYLKDSLGAPVLPGSLSIAWNDGSARTATDNGSGAITGDATGKIKYSTGEFELHPTLIPAPNQSYVFTYTACVPHSDYQSDPPQDGGGHLVVTLSPNIRPNTINLSWNVFYTDSFSNALRMAVLQLVDDGAGNLKRGATTIGTVNYTTGVLTFEPDASIPGPVGHFVGFPTVAGYRWVVDGYSATAISAEWMPGAGSWVDAYWQGYDTETPSTRTINSWGMSMDLTPGIQESLVLGSINFTFGGKTYFDRLGKLYSDLNPTTGAVTEAGTIDYDSGVAYFTAWASGGANTITLHSLYSTPVAQRPVDHVVFRIPAAPIRPSSLQILASRSYASESINVTADADGDIVGTNVLGTIDYQTGVVKIRFGHWVSAAGYEGSPWYHADAVVAGQLFLPSHVFAETIRYNAVAYSYLPLDADIIGLDPVRLPQDGRVPIFRAGDFAVIGHTATVGPATVSNAQVVNCARVRLSRVRVIGNNGVVITSGYTSDLEAGTVTFTDVSGYSQPVTVEHRIEDMAQVSDVQISGRLAFTRQITHAYPTGSMISSALVSGDLQSYVSHLFDQATWNGTFTDALSGSAATGTFNDILAPIVVTNAGAVTERWAILFTNSTAFSVIGEHVGVIATGNPGIDCQPLNPATGKPYFTIPGIGWGSGWSAGNVLRFNTTGALFPVWVVRTIQQGPETVTNDSFTMLIRGDVDAP